MTILQIEHNVSSYEGWKKAFDNDPINRKKSGVIKYQIYRSNDDPDYVVIDMYFSNVEDTKNTLKALQNLWPKVPGNIMVNPKARILNMVESIDL
jgi:quinol monooxygenase YgiN